MHGTHLHQVMPPCNNKYMGNSESSEVTILRKMDGRLCFALSHRIGKLSGSRAPSRWTGKTRGHRPFEDDWAWDGHGRAQGVAALNQRASDEAVSECSVVTFTLSREAL